jgi:hypothetical protein
MAVREWKTNSNGQCSIRLEHAYISGRASLYVDENLVFERPVTVVDYGFDHEFVVDDIPCVIRVRPTPFGLFRYDFLENFTLPAESPFVPQKPAGFLSLVAILSAFGFFFLIGAFFVQPPKREVMMLLGLVHVVVITRVVVKHVRKACEVDPPPEDKTQVS